MLYFYIFCYIIFIVSSFPTFVSTKTIIKNLIEGPVGCPLEGHVACNSHNPALKCLCYISEYASFTNIYPLCDDFDFGFVRYFVMEFKVNLTSRMQEKYNWNDFDLEMALLVEDAISVSAKNVVFLRKKCKGSDLILQFAVLKSQNSIPKKGKNFKNHEKIFEQIRVANHSFHNYMIENGAKFGISEVKEVSFLFGKTCTGRFFSAKKDEIEIKIAILKSVKCRNFHKFRLDFSILIFRFQTKIKVSVFS